MPIYTLQGFISKTFTGACLLQSSIQCLLHPFSPIFSNPFINPPRLHQPVPLSTLPSVRKRLRHGPRRPTLTRAEPADSVADDLGRGGWGGGRRPRAATGLQLRTRAGKLRLRLSAGLGPRGQGEAPLGRVWWQPGHWRGAVPAFFNPAVRFTSQRNGALPFLSSAAARLRWHSASPAVDVIRLSAAADPVEPRVEYCFVFVLIKGVRCG